MAMQIEIPPVVVMKHAPFDPNDRTTVSNYMEMVGTPRDTPVDPPKDQIYWFNIGQRILWDGFAEISLFCSQNLVPTHDAHRPVCDALLEQDGMGPLISRPDLASMLRVTKELMRRYYELYPGLRLSRYPGPQQNGDAVASQAQQPRDSAALSAFRVGRSHSFPALQEEPWQHTALPVAHGAIPDGDALQRSMSIAPQSLGVDLQGGQDMALQGAFNLPSVGDALNLPTAMAPPSLAPQPRPWEHMAPQGAIFRMPNGDAPVQQMPAEPQSMAPQPQPREYVAPRDATPAWWNEDAPIRSTAKAPQPPPLQPQLRQHMAPPAAIAQMPTGDGHQQPAPVIPPPPARRRRNNTKNMTAEQVRAQRPADTRSAEYQVWRREYKNVHQNEARRKAKAAKAAEATA